MPDWCQNYVEVTGDRKTLDKYGLLDGFSFDKIRPMPKELEGTVSPGDNPNWYDWCISNWGTKWDTEENEPYIISESGDGELIVSYRFSTAWAPPIELYQYMMDELDIYVNAKYYECGVGFYGYFDEHGEGTYDTVPLHEMPEGIVENRPL